MVDGLGGEESSILQNLPLVDEASTPARFEYRFDDL